MKHRREELKKQFNIKLPKSIGKVYYISPLVNKKKLKYLKYIKLLYIFLVIAGIYLTYDYFSMSYHPPVWKEMNGGYRVDIEPWRLFIYLSMIFLPLKEFLFHWYKISVVGDKGFVIYTFRFTQNHSSMYQKLFKEEDSLNINKFKDNYNHYNNTDDFIEELKEQWLIWKITRNS